MGPPNNQVQLAVTQKVSAPLDYVVPNAQEIELLAANAVFDGTDAVGAWLPALEILSDAGQVIARVFATPAVAPAILAEVTFAPFLSSPSSGGAGIHFTATPDPQTGKDLALLATEFFDVTVDNAAGSHCEIFMLAIPPQSVLRLLGGQNPGDLVVIDAGGGLLQIVAAGSSGLAGQKLTADGAGNCSWV